MILTVSFRILIEEFNRVCIKTPGIIVFYRAYRDQVPISYRLIVNYFRDGKLKIHRKYIRTAKRFMMNGSGLTSGGKIRTSRMITVATSQLHAPGRPRSRVRSPDINRNCIVSGHRQMSGHQKYISQHICHN